MIRSFTKQAIITVAVLSFSGALFAETEAAEDAALAERIKQGQAIAYDRSAGNCLSCHLVLGAELPGNIGPPLIQMKARYPDRATLISQISDAAKRNPNTVMPPYGRHNILTNKEIELVVDFVHSI